MAQNLISALETKNDNEEIDTLRLIVGTIVDKFVEICTNISLLEEGLESGLKLINEKFDMLNGKVITLENKELRKPVIPPPPPKKKPVTAAVVRKTVMDELNDLFKKRSSI